MIQPPVNTSQVLKRLMIWPFTNCCFMFFWVKNCYHVLLVPRLQGPGCSLWVGPEPQGHLWLPKLPLKVDKHGQSWTGKDATQLSERELAVFIHSPASCLTMGSCSVSFRTALSVGMARLSCICPRQKASSCLSRAESSLKALLIQSMASAPGRMQQQSAHTPQLKVDTGAKVSQSIIS